MKLKLFKNETHRNVIPSNIPENNTSNLVLNPNCIAQITEKKDFKPKSQNDLTRLGTNFIKNHIENNSGENYFIKYLVDNFIEYLSDQSTKDQKLFNKVDAYPMLLEKESIPLVESIENNNNNRDNINSFNPSNFLSLNLNGEFVKNLNLYNSNNNLSNLLSKIPLPESQNYNQSNGNPLNILKVENDANNNLKNLNLINNSNINNLTNNKTCSEFSNQIEDNLIYNKSKTNNMNNFNNIDTNYENGLNLFKNISSALNLNLEQQKDLNLSLNEDEKSILMRNLKSPNPFDDISFGHNSNIFNSPNPVEGMMYKLPNENNEKMNINFDLSRKSSIDYNEIFKSGTLENIDDKKLPRDNNLFFDDSFFSISSNDKKSEVANELNQLVQVYKNKPIKNKLNSDDDKIKKENNN